MPLQATAGAATYDAFGGGVTAANYIEDVFSTFLYTGNGSTQTITNGIDLSTKGGLVWGKNRDANWNHYLADTTQGTGKYLSSNSTGATSIDSTSLTAFNSNGFSIGNAGAFINNSSVNYASWTFRKQPKFFDVVTYTGNGGTLSVSHALASKPGCVIIKRTDSTSDWLVCTRKNTGNIYAMYLNTTAGQFYDGTEGSLWDSSSVSINWINSNVASGFNTNGASYVMYLFAHDAGGFGASGTDNVISCGSATGNLSTLAVTLGYEPQWLLFKRTDGADNWYVWDNMRGFGADSINSLGLTPNTSSVESIANYASVTSTGFNPNYFNPSTIIYIAIRRGPMRTPTTGTSVYQPLTGQPNGSGIFTHNILTDFSFYKFVAGSQNWGVQDRLRGSPDLSFSSTAAESALVGGNTWDFMTGYKNPNPGSGSYASWAFRRAPGFFDVVCYTGTGSARTVNHNLGAVPELMIAKTRSLADSWYVYTASVGNQRTLYLDASNPQSNTNVSYWNNTTPTVSVFTVGAPGGAGSANISGETYVAYLFATVAGVSKVGSYTGTGTTLQVNCGFTAGARFVLIKRTDSTGDWYVWDSARGIVAGSDPYLTLNTTAAEVTTTDWVDTYSAGFELSNAGGNNVNINGATYIFLSVA